MPFDDRTFPSAEAATSRQNRRLVAIWLFGVAFMVFGMVVLGGATRLTGSGLSIMEWAPVSGMVPPFSGTEWRRLFGLYQQIPQYKLLHAGMSLAGFKGIFWLEWTHRLWGRLIGLAFAGPLIYFAIRGVISRRMIPRLAMIFGLGGLQGFVGWYMVSSGYQPNAISVSPYRLVLHLLLALLLFGAVFWTALSTLAPVPTSIPGGRRLRIMAGISAGLVAATIVAGGFMAGLHAGLTYNSFPLMDGKLFPDGYGDLSPFLINLTENVTAVQFDHRCLATLTVAAVLVTMLVGWRARLRLPMPSRRALVAVGGAVSLQYLLGIATLLSVVAVPLAVAHQAVAVLLLASVLTLAHTLRGAK
jgi:cytochrome c oxidase assembly protein subunit 15